MKAVNYGYSRTVEGTDFDSVLEKTIAGLKSEGFGVLTEIDVQATLKKKLGVDFRRYKILGACNPPLAHKALLAEPPIGLLLPCNLVVAEEDDGSVAVAVLSPQKMFSLVDNPDLGQVAEEVEARLLRVLESID
jgi:uncharacterized protein (DUF302 family)